MDATPEELGELGPDPELELEPAGRPWLFWLGVAVVAGTGAVAWVYSRRLRALEGSGEPGEVPVELGAPRLRIRRPGAPDGNGASSGPAPDPASWDGAAMGAWGVAFGGPLTLDAVAEQNRRASAREAELESAGRDLERIYPELGEVVEPELDS